MTDHDRFAGLRKLPRTPVAAILAQAGAEIEDPEGLTLDGPPERVLAELDGRGTGGIMGQIRLLSRALPAREAVWWSCLAGRDIQPAGRAWPTLKAAEDWVFRPAEATRKAAQQAVAAARPDEETDLCARAAFLAQPTGPEAEHLRPGMVGLLVEIMVLKSLLAAVPDRFAARGRLLVNRALDIARGGNGMLEQTGGG
ncbi:MAG: hypothetical protein D6686_12135 [Alphaproteobacteria bacterium]|nr:MAG: hypothetical protein D6686_12135 [Alphaproteobacteria bacterium]